VLPVGGPRHGKVLDRHPEPAGSMIRMTVREFLADVKVHAEDGQ
jgi:hypothetical protein